MYIHFISQYLPEQVVSNEHFTRLNGLTDEWIITRTGIRERRKAGPDENTSVMGIEAVRRGIDYLPYSTDEIDLIVGATYTPHDTIVTLGHSVQHFLQRPDIPVLTISAACSSLLNAIEIVQGYFAMGKARSAVVVVSEHNTAYYREEDTVAGHLWGDGAAALFISTERKSPQDLHILDLMTAGAATVGRATDAVVLQPALKGFSMNHGRDVFTYACQYMAQSSQQILDKNGYTIDDLSYFIPHQANLRITKNVAENLALPAEKIVSNVEELGNTGCAGCAIALSSLWQQFMPGDLILVTVFGGGYSYGAMLVQR